MAADAPTRASPCHRAAHRRDVIIIWPIEVGKDDDGILNRAVDPFIWALDARMALGAPLHLTSWARLTFSQASEGIVPAVLMADRAWHAARGGVAMVEAHIAAALGGLLHGDEPR